MKTLVLIASLVSVSAFGFDGFRDCDHTTERCKRQVCSSSVVKSIDASPMISCVKVSRAPYPYKSGAKFDLMYYEVEILSSSLSKDSEVSATRIRIKDME